MKPAAAWGTVAAMALLSVLGLAAPWPVAGALSVGALAALRGGRAMYAATAATAVALHATVLALAVPGPHPVHLGPLALGPDGALRGVAGALRLTAVLGCNLALLSRVRPAVLLDGLRLPRRATALVAAVLLAAHDVALDAARLRDARRLEGRWAGGRGGRVASAAGLIAPILVASLRRAETRRDALRLAGLGTGNRFVGVVAVAALVVAGRLALVALPNVSLAYVAAFLGGLLLGPAAGALGALLGMALTDFLLTGLLPTGFVNAPAMALLGLAGGALRGVDLVGGTPAERLAGRLTALAVGIVGTLAFSVASDTGTWLLVAEYRGDPAAWRAIVAAGLVFNALPALVNGALFAATVTPVARASAALGQGPPRETVAARAPAPDALGLPPRG